MTYRKDSVSDNSSPHKKFRSAGVSADDFEFEYDPDKRFSVETIIGDTSAVIDGVLSRSVRGGRYRPSNVDVLNVIIPEAVLAELENQADSQRDTGVYGIDELLILRQMDAAGEIRLTFKGNRPTVHQIRDAKLGEVDALIRQTATDACGLFVTSDKIQAVIGKAKGLSVDYVPPVIREAKSGADISKLSILAFFDPQTMSVHLKKNVVPMAKRGSVGEMRYMPIRETPCTAEELSRLKSELLLFIKKDSESFVEIEYSGALILQVRDMRIAITEAPFSDDFEITAVRPIAHVDFENYQANAVLKERILQQRGILIAGAPGAGKSTFSAAVAKFLLEHGNVVKTMESPRDLQVPAEITQYAPLEGKMENTADLLLLVRPDYTIYDEVRKTQDFILFADMRLAGVGMIGVVHATRAIDAVQRLIGRIELGVIPQVVDTVIYIDKGQISKVYTLEFTVKVPHGMIEADLARPVIIVTDMAAKRTDYEIYTYGEQVVVMPVSRETGAVTMTERKPFWAETESSLEREIERYASGPFDVEMVSDTSAVVKVKSADKKKIIGRGGDTISRIESHTGLRIDVREMPVSYFFKNKSRMKDDDGFGQRSGNRRSKKALSGMLYDNENGSEYGGEHGNEYGSKYGNEYGSDGNEYGNEYSSEHDNEHGSEHGNKHGRKHDGRRVNLRGNVCGNVRGNAPETEFTNAAGGMYEQDYAVPIFEKTKKHFILKVPEFSTRDVDIYISGKPFFSATVGRGGEIKLRTDSELVEKIKACFRNGELIEVRPAGSP
ncbi:MAG: PINc/VapC family ATPase [Methanimicrococcus sp.]|nr:PINc/VapC family ATPase [Methanimicrococcus sp.]